jgi:hypothetical protein
MTSKIYPLFGGEGSIVAAVDDDRSAEFRLDLQPTGRRYDDEPAAAPSIIGRALAEAFV